MYKIAEASKWENEVLKRDLDAFKTSVVSHMPKLLHTMERLDTWLETKGQSPQPQLPSPSSIQGTLEMHPGSGVYVPKKCVVSNLRGGMSKKADPGEAKEALDVAKVDALMNAMIQKFPGTTRGQLGVALNQKLTELRASKKN
ncbi:hypothetical protein AOLI_G00063140 [Acnodon oligacanthus]